jgi:serine O-acetyltransferase
MMKNEPIDKPHYCPKDFESSTFYDGNIPGVVDQLLDSCYSGSCFSNLNSASFPSQESVIKIIQLCRGILFPGYFTKNRIDSINLKFYLGQEISQLFEVLSEQISLSIRHDCLRSHHPCTRCLDRGHDSADIFIQSLPSLRLMLAKDVRAAFEGDPAAKSDDEIIFSYPGFFAITVYRLANNLYELDVPLLPRMMTEYAHALTGIDIHPGAKIGESFFIDHGTGVVIGETAVIGNRVRLYQGVTIGALSLPKNEIDLQRNQKRHPTIEDDVIIYSNATVLGGETIIDARSIIGGNVWITESIPPETKVLLKQPELLYIEKHSKLKGLER